MILTNFTLFKLEKFTSSFGLRRFFLSPVKYDQLSPTILLFATDIPLAYW